jgi:hypothetical protein
MKKNMQLGLAAGLAALLSMSAVAAAGIADYAREKKWADEVVPGLVWAIRSICKPRAGITSS